MKAIALLIFALISTSVFAEAELWRGLTVEEEYRCAPYDKKDYPYPQSIEDEIVESLGAVYGAYSGVYFENDTMTDIEHLVATSEAHDSGLCAMSDNVKKAYSTDLLNLALASLKVNRCSTTGKCGLDAGEWLPEKNKCWFANRVLLVKTKYKLSVDRREANALENIISKCESFELIFHEVINGESELELAESETVNSDTLSKFDDNKNGKISCSEARAHHITPVLKHHEAYKYMNDRDGDGVVCK